MSGFSKERCPCWKVICWAWGLAVLFFLALPGAVRAQYTYTTNHFPDENTLTITAYTGAVSVVDIPPSIGGKTVTIIGDMAFYNLTNLYEVTIPDSVTQIGTSAFDSCYRLASVTLGNGITNIGDGAFFGCTDLLSVTIPDSVTRIGEGAFDSCWGLASVALGNGVINIEGMAFEYCTNLLAVTIPDNVAQIGEDAFNYCSQLAAVTLGNGVTNIGENAFRSCTRLATILVADDNAAFPASVLTLAHHAVTGRSSFCHVFHFL